MTAELNQTLDAILRGENLDEAAAAELMESLTDEALSPVLSGALLVALRAKGETADELRGFARRMRALFLNAQAAHDSAPTVAKIIARELDYSEDWASAEAQRFQKLACQYQVKA